MATQRTEKGEAPVIGPTEASGEANPMSKESNMANSTQTAPSRAITVPFHGVDLYVVEHNGQPYTPMKPIVTAMGLDWGSQFRKVAANEARWGIVNLTIPSTATVVDSTIVGSADGKSRDLTCIPVRKVAAWLTTVEPGKVKNPEVRSRVVMYQNECDDVLWQYWNEGIAINPRAAYSVNPDQTLSAEQAETLRLLLTENVKKLPKEKQGGAMVKGWSKLKAHFKTDYRHIPAGEFHEAVNILARHVSEWELVDDAPKAGTVQEIVADWVKKIEEPNGYPAVLFEPIVQAVQRKIGRNQPEQADAVRTKAAFDAASQASAAVQSAVFNAVLSGNEEWKYSRWVLAFIDDSAKGSPAYVRQMNRGDFVTNWPRLVRDVATGECMCSSKELLDMAYACMQRMAHFPSAARMAA